MKFHKQIYFQVKATTLKYILLITFYPRKKIYSMMSLIYLVNILPTL